MLNDVFQYFVGSYSLMPRNLTGKITLGRWFYQDIWHQSLGTISNLNLFQSRLRPENMLRMSQRLEGKSSDESGLTRNNLNWNFIGDKIKVMQVEEGELYNQDKT